MWEALNSFDGSFRNKYRKMRQVQQYQMEIQQMETEIQWKKIDNHRLGDEVCQHTEQVMRLGHKLHHTSHDSEQLVAELQQSLEQKNEVTRSKEQILQEKERQIKQLQQSLSDKRKGSTAAHALRLQFRSGSKAPLKTFGASSVVDGGFAYFYCTTWRQRKGAVLPECPKDHSPQLL